MGPSLLSAPALPGVLGHFRRLALPASTGQLVLTVVDKDTGKPVTCRMHLRGPEKAPLQAGQGSILARPFCGAGQDRAQAPRRRLYVRHRARPGVFATHRILHHQPLRRRFETGRTASLHRYGGRRLVVGRSGRSPPDPRRRVLDAGRRSAPGRGDRLAERQDRPRPVNRRRSHGSASTAIATIICWPARGRAGHGAVATESARAAATAGDGQRLSPDAEDSFRGRGKGELWVDANKPFWWDLPMLVAAGQIDSIEIAHSHLCRDASVDNEADGKPRDRKRYPSLSGDAEWSQEIYFRLLECGLRIPPSAGSGSGEAPNPIGYNRVYVHVEGPLTPEKWWQGLRAGQAFITNGPLMRPTVEGELPGHVFAADGGHEIGTRNRLDLFHPRIDQLSGDHQGRPRGARSPLRRVCQGEASCRSSHSTAAAGFCSAPWPTCRERTALP